MGALVGPIIGQNRSQVAPTPVLLAVYDDRLVLVRASGRVHWRRFVAGAGSGGADNVLTDVHETDSAYLSNALAGISADEARQLVALAREHDADALAARPRAESIALSDVASVLIEPHGTKVKIVISRSGGGDETVYIAGTIAVVSAAHATLVAALGDRVSTKGLKPEALA